MVERPPGTDPVADHTWCCEHPEPWRYFRPEAEERLLSGLERVYPARLGPAQLGLAWSFNFAHFSR